MNLTNKLNLISKTKEDIRLALIEMGMEVPLSIPFRQYADLISSGCPGGGSFVPKPVGPVPGVEFGGGTATGVIRINGEDYMLIVSGGNGDSNNSFTKTLAWKTSNTADSVTDGVAPASMNDGLANMQYFRDNGIANYPAAKWIEDNCNSGTGLNGFTDWYLPSRDELEIVYRMCKPDTTANASGSGINPNAVPPTSGYTASVPARTSLSNFRTGGADQFVNGYYWSSSVYTSARSWDQVFGNGGQGRDDKTSAYYVRAVRRIKIS